MKTKDSLDTLLSEAFDPLPPPRDLNRKIQRAISKKSGRIEELNIVGSFLKIFVGLALFIYAINALIYHLMNSQLWIYIKSVFQEPSMLFSPNGLLGFYEQVPLISALLATVGFLYTVRHMIIRGIERSPRLYASMLTALFVSVIGCAFLGGVSLGSYHAQGVGNAKTLFPFVQEADQFQHSVYGTVLSVNKEKNEVTLKVINEKDRTILLDEDTFVKGSIRVGEQMLVLGRIQENDPSVLTAQFVDVLSN